MRKILTIVGTRPELIKLSCVIREFDKYTNHIIVHTGQNFDYELNQIFFNDLNIRKPDYFLEANDVSASKTIANILYKVDDILDKELPDGIMIYGDTNSCLAAIVAKRKKIPIFHMEAGNRSFDLRVPEEINRKIVDHISDVNFVLTEHARRYLISEGINPAYIFKSGSHMFEVLENYKKDIKNSKILDSLNIKKSKYFLASIHREENVDDIQNLRMIFDAFESLKINYDVPIFLSTHPRTLNSIKTADIRIPDGVNLLKPFGFFDYVKLQLNALCVLSDSGTITEESSILKFPAIMVRNTHERPEGMDEGSVVMSGLDKESISNAIDIVTKQFNDSIALETPADYLAKNVSKKILRVVMSYIDNVNSYIWHKH